MSISVNTRQAYAEIDEFLRLLDEEDRNKIPVKLRELFKREKDKEYSKDIDINKPIEEQNLKEETLTLIAILYLEYWCENEKEKEELKDIYRKNEEIYQRELNQKYNPDNLFKKSSNNKNEEEKDKIKVDNEQTNIIVYKESIIRKIFNKIKSLFK